MPLFTKKQLKELAIDTSYQRGQEYYEEGYVRKITRKGNVFEGTVDGSYRYRVKLEIHNGKLLFTCSCPYDYGGICKHSVAFGLAVLEEEYTDVAGYASFVEDAQIVEEPASFDVQFMGVNDAAKISFLQELLNKDVNLRSQFLHFVQSWKKENLANNRPLSLYDNIRLDVREALVALQFDEDTFSDYNTSYDDYYGEGDELYEMAREMVEEVLEPHVSTATEVLRQGKLLESCRILFATYEGIRQTEEPDADEFSLFDGEDYQSFVLRVFQELQKDFLAALKTAVVHTNEVCRTFDLLLERYVHYETIYDKHSAETQVFYELTHFEPLLLALANTVDTARYLQALLEKHQLVDTNTAHVLLHIAKITSNETLWLQTAEEFAPYAMDITLQLLDKYLQKQQREPFIRVARQAFQKEPVLFDEYIITHLKPEEDQVLYLQALEYYTRRKQSITHYRVLQKFWNGDERQIFIKSFSTGYNYLFYVQLLEAEGLYKHILEVLKKFNKQEIRSFDQMLATVAHHFPDECMDLVMEKSEHALQSERRGRQTYQEIASWLKVLKAVPALDGQLKLFSQHLYDQNPRLRALREELQYAGLVRGKR